MSRPQMRPTFINFMKKITDFIIETITILIVSLILAFLISRFLVGAVVVNGSSMEPTLKSGEFGFNFIFNKHHLERFDIVVVEVDTSDKHIVKRIIGLPSDHIQYKDNVLYINGEMVEEDYLANGAYTEDLEITLQEDEYFLLGDNRNYSRDSRYYGTFSKDEIVANGILILYPFSNFGIK